MFTKYLTSSALEIDRILDQIFRTWKKEIKHVDPRVLKLLDLSIQASEGGKRLRGTLVKLGYELANGKNSEILKIACAYEIFQTAILAHDDIIDKSDLRRGRPTLYKMLGGDHYGVSQTIVLGDIGFFIAFQLISQTNFQAKAKVEAIKAFSGTMVDTAFGEMLDVELSRKKVKEADVLEIARYKTAWYTLVGPLTLGAALSGGDQKLLNLLESFGINLGIAFQIQDDILGVFGKESEIGKRVTSDIEEGKNTLLITQALKKANSKDKKYLNSHYGQGKITKEELRRIRQLFIFSGAVDYANKMAIQKINKAKQLIPKLTKDQRYQQLLNQLADYQVNRVK